jgi:hypothetical protein
MDFNPVKQKFVDSIEVATCSFVVPANDRLGIPASAGGQSTAHHAGGCAEIRSPHVFLRYATSFGCFLWVACLSLASRSKQRLLSTSSRHPIAESLVTNQFLSPEHIRGEVQVHTFAEHTYVE